MGDNRLWHGQTVGITLLLRIWTEDHQITLLQKLLYRLRLNPEHTKHEGKCYLNLIGQGHSWYDASYFHGTTRNKTNLVILC